MALTRGLFVKQVAVERVGGQRPYGHWIWLVVYDGRSVFNTRAITSAWYGISSLGVLVVLTDFLANRRKHDDQIRATALLDGLLHKAYSGNFQLLLDTAFTQAKDSCRQSVQDGVCYCLRCRVASVKRLMMDTNSTLALRMRDVISLLYQCGSSQCAAIRQYAYIVFSGIADSLDRWCREHATTPPKPLAAVMERPNKRTRVDETFKQWVRQPLSKPGHHMYPTCIQRSSARRASRSRHVLRTPCKRDFNPWVPPAAVTHHTELGCL